MTQEDGEQTHAPPPLPRVFPHHSRGGVGWGRQQRVTNRKEMNEVVLIVVFMELDKSSPKMRPNMKSSRISLKIQNKTNEEAFSSRC